jgi:5-methylcytosine-specific restriction enzyme subunit McrC
MRERGVAGNPPTLAQISGERFGRHDADDRLMVDAAKLIFDLSIPTEVYGHQVLSLPDREIMWVRRLFERAIGGFFAHALGSTGWRVRCGATQKWHISEQSSGMQRLLPSMRTDIILDQALEGRRLVIDTKFNSIVSPGWYREETLRSGYIYQMYTYIRSQVGLGDPLADSAFGLLLHPSVGIDVDEHVVIQGHKIRFATIDLTGTHSNIRAELLKLI